MNLDSIRDEALRMAEPQFKKFEPIALHNTKKVLEAFKECQLSDYHFNGSSGYGYIYHQIVHPAAAFEKSN